MFFEGLVCARVPRGAGRGGARDVRRVSIDEHGTGGCSLSPVSRVTARYRLHLQLYLRLFLSARFGAVRLLPCWDRS